jgi:membrane-associated protein
MKSLKELLDFFLHIDDQLETFISLYKSWTYAILFLIIFVETGVVIMPFLPGDSLLFAAGALAARFSDILNVWYLILLMFVAAVLGDTVNYHIGKFIGPRAFSGNIKFLEKEYLDKTQAFFDKYGGKAIIFARFVPIVRTFAPFVAGVGTMQYSKFIVYNLIGGLVWVTVLTLAGYFFGGIPIIKDNFEIVVLLIIFISILPPVIEYFRNRKTAGSKS